MTYGYDLAGHLTGVSDTSAAITAAVPPGGSPVQYAASYGYDAMNRSTGVSWTPAATPAAPTASSVTFGHSYNADNQRVGQSISDNSWVNYPAATASTVSYTANALNQYTAVGPVSPTYDGNGNLTSDGTFTFGYDAENRLTSASGVGNTAAYAFDAQSRRKTRTVNGTTTVFVTDADNREVLEYDGGSGAIQRWYAYNLRPNDVVNQTNVVAATRAALIPDIQGSIIASLDSGSGSLSKLGYLPYGKSVSAGPFGFTGQRVDVETGGLYYYRARHYSPAWGRFLQVDPIGYQGGINLYAYVNNDPLNNTDLLGLDALVIVGEQRSDSYNVFGHVAIAVTGGGIFSFGTGTALGSSVSAYVNSQSQFRSQTIYTIQTSPQQDAAMLSYLQAQSDNIGLIDNCAARTCGALNAGGVLNSLVTARTPDAVGAQVAMIGLSGGSVNSINIPQNTSAEASLTSQFEPFTFASPTNPPTGPGK